MSDVSKYSNPAWTTAAAGVLEGMVSNRSAYTTFESNRDEISDLRRHAHNLKIKLPATGINDSSGKAPNTSDADSAKTSSNLDERLTALNKTTRDRIQGLSYDADGLTSSLNDLRSKSVERRKASIIGIHKDIAALMEVAATAARDGNILHKIALVMAKGSIREEASDSTCAMLKSRAEALEQRGKEMLTELGNKYTSTGGDRSVLLKLGFESRSQGKREEWYPKDWHIHNNPFVHKMISSAVSYERNLQGSGSSDV